MAALSSDPAHMMVMSSSQSAHEPHQNSDGNVPGAEEGEPQKSQVDVSARSDGPGPIDDAQPDEAEELGEPTLPPPATLKRQASAISLGEGSSFSGQDHFVKSFNSTPGYLANRWNNMNSSFSTPAASQKPVFTTPNMLVLSLNTFWPHVLT